MSDDLLLFCPSNLVMPAGSSMAHVTGDVYNLCARVREIDPDLRVIPFPEDARYPFGIAYIEPGGTERLIFKAKNLDARIVDRLRKIMALPIDLRLKRIEHEQAKREKEATANELDELYEKVGRPMWTQLEHDGFNAGRGISFPKLGVAAGGKRAR